MDGSGKGIVLDINHDIVPQVIGKTITGVSRKEDNKGNVTQAHNQHRRKKRKKGQKNKRTKEQTKLP